MLALRSCLSAEEIALYVCGSSLHHADVEAHIEQCEDCRLAVAAVVRGRRPADGSTDTVTLDGLTAVAKRLQPRRIPKAQEYALATLRDEEVRAARTMIRMGRVVGIAAILPAPFFGRVPAVQLTFIALVVAAIILGIVIERRIRNPARYSERAMLVLAVHVVLAGLSGMLYYGIFSGAQLFPVLSIYVFSRREQFRNTLAIYLLTAAGQLILAAIVISGLVPDPGLFEPNVSPVVQVVGHILIQIGDLAAFAVGWASRRDTEAALKNGQKAMMLAAKREALLEEARGDLDRAIRVGGAGRYTDQTLGSYRLGNILGRGGMGEVYEAQHVDTHEPAAVKLLAPRELANPRSVERFVREVRAVSALTSHHVVRVLDASGAGDPIPYLVMERLRGQTLAQLLRSSQPHDRLLEMLAEVGEAVEEAWKHGIVHRDLKPHNLFLAEQPNGWKVLDFGVAALAEHGGTLTEGQIVGTPAYMAPEQARGERVDYRADIYALTAIAYRWLTGQPVCTGKDVRASLYQIVHVAPARPGSIAELAPDVDAVLAIGLAKDPADRWSTVSDLGQALRAALTGRLDHSLRQRALDILVRHPWGVAR